MNVKSITVHDLKNMFHRQDDICILDVRSEEKFKEKNIETDQISSLNIPKDLIFNLDQNSSDCIAQLPKNKNIIVTCTTGNSAKKCATILQEKGYNVSVLDGGITSWIENS